MDTKRFKWVFIIVMVVVGVAAQIGVLYARQIPVQQRGPWMIAIMALIVVPFAFIYGRNSARKDGFGKLSRVFVYGAVLCVLVGMLLGRQWLVFEGLGAGFLIGYALGWLVQRRAREKYGDTLEADQFLNITRSERTPRPERPAAAFLKSQGKPTQRLLRGLRTVEALAIFASLGLAAWLTFGDYVAAVPRMLFVHKGDGARFFVTLDGIVATVPLVILLTVIVGIACEVALRKLAGPKKDVWIEYKAIRDMRRGSRRMGKAYTVFLCAVVCAAVLTMILYMDTYVKVTDQSIAINRFWGLGVKLYHWNEVRGVEIGRKPYICKNGHQHTRLRVRIAFTDGSDWVPDTSVARRAPQIEAAARYAAGKTGL